MKNTNKNMLKTAIFMDFDAFRELVQKITGYGGNVSYDGYGIYVSENGMSALEKYFDVSITSVHADDCDFTGVWVVYK